VQKWFSNADSGARFCYAGAASLRDALSNTKVVDTLFLDICVPVKPEQFKRLAIEDKLEAIEKEVLHRKNLKTSQWHDEEELEILAGELWLSPNLQAGLRAKLWPVVKKEADLLEPVAKHLRSEGFEAYREVPMGRNRIDLLGHKVEGWIFKKDVVVGVELKNELAEFSRGIDQMTTFASYTHEVYLACTPTLAAQYVAAHARARGVKRWDGDVLKNKLERAGIGLLLVEGNRVEVCIEAETTDLHEKKWAELADHLVAKNRV
jgi:hypothetical protein